MRIYLDKQILSRLFKADIPKYRELLEKIYDSKDHLLYCFSHAHLLDLNQDKTEIKYSELDFIESIVDNNYIAYNSSKKTTQPYLAKPKEAFLEGFEEEKINFKSFFSSDKIFETEEEKILFRALKELFFNLKLDFNFWNDDNLDPKYQNLIDNLFPDRKDYMSIYEIYEAFFEVHNRIQNIPSIYKELRNFTDLKYYEKFQINYNEIDFNDELKNSELKLSFIDYVKKILENQNNDYSRRDFFCQAYVSLDLLGISREPSKTVKFKNMVFDSLHSYYGAYCDIVISDDSGFLKKTKVLYKLLDIDTKVLDADEFIKTFSFTIQNKEKGKENFAPLLKHDLNNGLIINSKKSIRYNRETITIKPLHNYFGHFNRIDRITQDGIDYVYLYREIRNYSSSVNMLFYREIELIVNIGINYFGIDSNSKKHFEWDKEIEEINQGNWQGRFWDFDDFEILIDINEGTKNIGLQFTFNKS